MKSTKPEAKRLELVEQVSRSVKELLMARQDIRLDRVGPAVAVKRASPAIGDGCDARPRLLPSLNQGLDFDPGFDLDFDDMPDEIEHTLH